MIDWKPRWLSDRSIKTVSLKRNEDTELKNTLTYFSQKIELMLPRKTTSELARCINSACEDFGKAYNSLEQYQKEDISGLAITTTSLEFNQTENTVQLCRQAAELEIIANLFDLGKRWEVWSGLVSLSGCLAELGTNKPVANILASKGGKGKKGFKSGLHLAIAMIFQENNPQSFKELEKLLSDEDFISDFSERLDPPAPCRLFEYKNEQLHYRDKKGIEKTVSQKTLRNIFTKCRKTVN